MNNIVGWVGATSLATMVGFYPQEVAAEGFTGEQFLAWSIDGQNNYIGTAVTMATFVASRTNSETSTCLNTWYAASESTSAQRNADIRSAIARNAEFHPSAVILLVLEDACGAFTP